MSDKNVCPYCGGEVIAGFVEFRGVQGYQAHCKRCGAKGPVLVVASESWHIEILESFCHPAHLMESLHTYDPETEVKIKRETGEYCFYRLEAAGLKYGGSPVGLAAMADLTTALGVK